MSTQSSLQTISKDLAEFDELLATVTQSVKPIYEIKVTDPASELAAKGAGGQISTLLKRIEARRKELLEPLKAQVDAINAAAKKVVAVLDQPDAHIRTQLNAYAMEVTRKRNEELRLQREKEEAERRAAEEKRRQEEAALRAKQEEERRAREEWATRERTRILAEHEAKQKKADEEAAARASAANLFGAGRAEQERVEREAAEAKRRADEQAAAEQKAADARAAAERLALEAQQERERIAEQARLEREESERQAKLEAERQAIASQKVKGAKTEIVISVVDIWAVPREFLREPELKLAEAKKALKEGREIPGLTFREEAKVSLRSETVPSIGALA